MGFRNAYEDPAYAAAYAKLEFPGTYYLAYRDLPAIIGQHVTGRRALDFGCGAGRSTRFLRRHGFEATGVDIAADMIREAEGCDPQGDYRLIANGDFAALPRGAFDLVLSAFTFDNVATRAKKVELFSGIRDLLAPDGVVINLVSSPDIYTHEWVSFSTMAFPENARAQSGDVVRIINLAIADKRPCEDVLWTDEAYQDVFRSAGLVQVRAHRPLAREGEHCEWVNETRIPPWVTYVLGKVG